MKPLHVAGAALLILAVPASVLDFSLANDGAERGPVARISLSDIPQAGRAPPTVQHPGSVASDQIVDGSTQSLDETSAAPSGLAETRRSVAVGVPSTTPPRVTQRTAPTPLQNQNEISDGKTSALVLPEAIARPIAPEINRSAVPYAQPMRLPPAPPEERSANLSQPQSESPQDGPQSETVEPGLSSDSRDARKALRDIRPR